MGKTPDDIAREIRDLRDETEAIVDELARRATPGHVVREVTSSVTHRAEDVAGSVLHRTETLADDVGRAMPASVKRNPSIAGGAVLGMIASLGAFAFASLVRERERSTAERARDQVESSATDLRGALDQLGDTWRQAREEISKGRRVQVVVQREEPSILKRVAWVGLVSVMGTVGAILFQRLSAQMWRRTLHEEPPKK